MYKNSTGYKYDDDEDYVPTKKVKYSEKDNDESIIPNKKHTLDSDEEEDDDDDDEKGKNYDILHDEDIDGQEDSTIDYEGETKITPFNMKEEMEEGHFDQEGFYHFKKENEHLKDAWLDNIDWVKIKHTKGAKPSTDEEEAEDDNATEANNLIHIYEEIFPYLKEGETVAKAIKRFGGKSKRLTSVERWKLKKQGKLTSASGSDMESFSKLTELANKVIETGNMDAYEETYEMIRLKIERSKASRIAAPPPAEAAYDMFAEEVPPAASSPAKGGSGESGEQTSSPIKDTFDEVKWVYRWENTDEAETHGPFETSQMLKWQESGYFKKGAYIRKTTDTLGNWYHSARIDFDLYT